MTSSDREILIAIQGEVHELRMIVTEQGARITRMESRLDDIESLQVQTVNRLNVLEARFDMLLWGVGIGFAFLAVMMGICTWIITALPFLRSKREDSPAPGHDNTPALIESLIELMRFTREESGKH